MARRYTTDCVTGRRVYRWYARVGRPERAVVWPCARAAIIGAPLLGVPLPSAPLPESTSQIASGGLGGPVSSAALPWLTGREWEQTWAVGSPVAAGESPAPFIAGGAIVAPLVVSYVIPSSPAEQPRVAVPEPATWALLGIGAAAAAVLRRAA